MFADFGAGIGPFILGVIIPIMGYRNLYIIMAALVILSIVLYFLLHGKNQLKQQLLI